MADVGSNPTGPGALSPIQRLGAREPRANGQPGHESQATEPPMESCEPPMVICEFPVLDSPPPQSRTTMENQRNTFPGTPSSQRRHIAAGLQYGSPWRTGPATPLSAQLWRSIAPEMTPDGAANGSGYSQGPPRITITVPERLGQDRTVRFDHQGTTYSVTIPPDYSPGSRVEVELTAPLSRLPPPPPMGLDMAMSPRQFGSLGSPAMNNRRSFDSPVVVDDTMSVMRIKRDVNRFREDLRANNLVKQHLRHQLDLLDEESQLIDACLASKAEITKLKDELQDTQMRVIAKKEKVSILSQSPAKSASSSRPENTGAESSGSAIAPSDPLGASSSDNHDVRLESKLMSSPEEDSTLQQAASDVSSPEACITSATSNRGDSLDRTADPTLPAPALPTLSPVMEPAEAPPASAPMTCQRLRPPGSFAAAAPSLAPVMKLQTSPRSTLTNYRGESPATELFLQPTAIVSALMSAVAPVLPPQQQTSAAMAPIGVMKLQTSPRSTLTSYRGEFSAAEPLLQPTAVVSALMSAVAPSALMSAVGPVLPPQQQASAATAPVGVLKPVPGPARATPRSVARELPMGAPPLPQVPAPGMMSIGTRPSLNNPTGAIQLQAGTALMRGPPPTPQLRPRSVGGGASASFAMVPPNTMRRQLPTKAPEESGYAHRMAPVIVQGDAPKMPTTSSVLVRQQSEVSPAALSKLTVTSPRLTTRPEPDRKGQDAAIVPVAGPPTSAQGFHPARSSLHICRPSPQVGHRATDMIQRVPSPGFRRDQTYRTSLPAGLSPTNGPYPTLSPASALSPRGSLAPQPKINTVNRVARTLR